MSVRVANSKSPVVPVMRYRDAAAMIAWLRKAFEFGDQKIILDRHGKVTYAELTCGDGVIMIGPVGVTAFDKLMVQPDEIGGVETQCCYLVVPDADAHCARARAAGAAIVMDVKDEDDGGRIYACCDPEGHIWNFGTYDPRQAQSPAESKYQFNDSPPRKRSMLVPVFGCITVAALTAAGWMYVESLETKRRLDTIATLQGPPTPRAGRDQMPQDSDVARLAERQAKELRTRLTEVSHAKEVAERTALETRNQLAQERVSKEAALRNAVHVKDQLTQEITAKCNANLTAQQTGNQLVQERNAKAAAERLATEASDQLARERAAKIVADRSAREVIEELGRERMTKIVVERSARDANDQLNQERNARAAAELSANELRNQLVQVTAGDAHEQTRELREQLGAARNAGDLAERAAREARQQLAQERAFRDAAERAHKEAQERCVSAPPASCWLYPAGTGCNDGNVGKRQH